MIILDTSGLLSAFDASQTHYAVAADALRRVSEPRLLSPFVLAELACLLTTRVSGRAAQAVLREVADGAYQLNHSGPMTSPALWKSWSTTPTWTLAWPMPRWLAVLSGV